MLLFDEDFPLEVGGGGGGIEGGGGIGMGGGGGGMKTGGTVFWSATFSSEILVKD